MNNIRSMGLRSIRAMAPRHTVRQSYSMDHVRHIGPVFCGSYIRNMKMKTTEIGRLGETAVCQQLEQQGYSIVRRNFCVRGGEIDIIAENGEYLAFVEVKTRKPNSLTSGFDDVTAKKQARLIQTAAVWCAEHPTELQPRFDIACVVMQGKQILSVDYLENAFDTTGSDFIF